MAEAVDRAARYSPFLVMLMAREPALTDRLRAGEVVSGFTSATADMPVARRLRIDRRALALTVAIGDLSGEMDLSAVTAALTDFADRALDSAIRAAIMERTPDAEPRGFAAIALGKQGSRELNYSSDIDPILIYDPATLPRRPREEPEEAAVRIARRVVDLLQTRDGDGYVLRVDLRLRPSPEATPIALPVHGAIAYYESQALTWERAAFIRARAAAGDLALGGYFLDAVRPFVWRRGLDFGAIDDIRDLSRRIRDHYASGQAIGPGYDLKRGRGGIREAEFFAQIHQLIHGGRDPALRAPATRDALARLAEAGWIGDGEAATLISSYTLLRTIEHRVQMIDDRQTHSLPAGEALDRVARLHGLAAGAELIALIAPAATAAGRVYDALDAGRPTGFPYDPVPLAEALSRSGFAATDEPVRHIAAWRSGRYPALRSPAARKALEMVLPVLMPALAAAPDPAAALLRLDRMLGHLSSAINILRLLEARPGLAALLATILSLAPALADGLALRPEMLDGLIDASAFDPAPAVPRLVAEMQGPRGGDYQTLLDHVRRVVGERRFALGAQIVAGIGDPLIVGTGYARVAEAAVETLAAATVRAFAASHGHVADSELLILGFGRLGGGTLTDASDLDLVYLFTGSFTAESDGDRPLGATLYYNRLAQRITAALSVPTAAGALYEVDTRLRPSGRQGPLVVSLESFARYQREDAWTWEHMALARARPIFGSEPGRAAAAAVIAAVLRGERPARDIRTDAIAMRGEVARHKPAAGPLDVKLLPGGLVDLEFLVHVAQLEHRTGFDPALGDAIAALVAAGMLPPELAAAHDLLTRLLIVLRLVAPDAQEPAPATRQLIATVLGATDWTGVMAMVQSARDRIGAAWQATAGGDDERSG